MSQSILKVDNHFLALPSVRVYQSNIKIMYVGKRMLTQVKVYDNLPRILLKILPLFPDIIHSNVLGKINIHD